MLLDDVRQTIDVAKASLERAWHEPGTDARMPALYLESLSISEAEKEGAVKMALEDGSKVDPVVAYIIGATNGSMYKHLIGRLNGYPIPEIELPDGDGKTFLDLGCSWGRWCIAAAQKGYEVVGIDPSLGAIMAARRVSDSLGLSIRYLVADARFLPFAPTSFHVVFSYSVLQHLSKGDVSLVTSELTRVLCHGGCCLVQMPTVSGVRCLYHQVRRRFREACDFEVRYWSIPALMRMFGAIGRTEISVDCYFGIGLQKADYRFMPKHLKLVLLGSDWLTRASRAIPFLKYAADSVYVTAVKN